MSVDPRRRALRTFRRVLTNDIIRDDRYRANLHAMSAASRTVWGGIKCVLLAQFPSKNHPTRKKLQQSSVPTDEGQSKEVRQQVQKRWQWESKPREDCQWYSSLVLVWWCGFEAGVNECALVEAFLKIWKLSNDVVVLLEAWESDGPQFKGKVTSTQYAATWRTWELTWPEDISIRSP